MGVKPNKQVVNRRGQMAIVGIGLWALLALWSISAFWQHIDSLGVTYSLMAKCGAIAGEAALLALIYWHCFDKHLGVRFWSLILSGILATAIVIHAGALRGMTEAQAAQIDIENRLADRLTEMSNKQVGSIKADNNGTRRERLAKNQAAVRQQTEIAKSAQKEVADAIRSGSDKVKDSSILPRWYLDGWMYSALFVLSLGFVSVIFFLMMRDDIDADFDGIPDKHQYEFPTSANVGK